MIKFGGGAFLALLFTVVALGAFFASYAETQAKEKSFQACVEAGNSPQECSDAVHGSLQLLWSSKDKK